MAKDQTLKALLASIQSKKAEVVRLQAQIEALQEVYDKEAGIKPAPEKPKVSVKATILGLLDQAGASGLNANIACAMAQADGVELHSKSVSSLLSRFKSDGTVVHDGSKYYLPEHRQKKPTMPGMPGIEDDPVVRPLRTSGHMP